MDEGAYVDFLCRAFEPVVRHLAPGGTICINLSNGIFEPGLPTRSLYRERLLIALRDRFQLHLADTLIWFNPCRPPGPVQWASKTRQQLNDSYETIHVLTNDPLRFNADNRRVLQEHSKRHMALMAAGGESRHASYADGAYVLKPGSFGQITEGRIPRNVIMRGHRCADTQRYRNDAKALGLPIHGAMQPLEIPEFLIKFLSKEGDVVLDPFGGTCTTAMAAERQNRRWLVIEKCLDYIRPSAERFRNFAGFRMPRSIASWPTAA
jgi:site-specific DNA-methyltransferase (cytosine-N4-specific)